MKPTLKPSGTQRLKLNYNVLLPIFAFNFNLRSYIQARVVRAPAVCQHRPAEPRGRGWSAAFHL